MPDQTVTGACLCGAVRFKLEGPFGHMTHCHCSVCRKHHGAPFATFVASPLKGLASSQASITRAATSLPQAGTGPSA